jgi:hypothetical protein
MTVVFALAASGASDLGFRALTSAISVSFR